MFLVILLCTSIDLCTVGYSTACLLLAVPGPVVNLRIVLVTSTSLEVQWSPPTQANGVIVRYLLDYKSSNPTISPNSVLVVPANSSSFLVSNLQEGLTYEVKMRAETMIGPGQAVSVSASTYTAGKSRLVCQAIAGLCTCVCTVHIDYTIYICGLVVGSNCA